MSSTQVKSRYLLRRARLEAEIRTAIDRSLASAPAIVSGVSNAGKTLTCEAIRSDAGAGPSLQSIALKIDDRFFKDLAPSADAIIVRLLQVVFRALVEAQGDDARKQWQVWRDFGAFAAAFADIGRASRLPAWAGSVLGLVLVWWDRIFGFALAVLAIVFLGLLGAEPSRAILSAVREAHWLSQLGSLGSILAAFAYIANWAVARQKARAASGFRPRANNRAATAEFGAAVALFRIGLKQYLARRESQGRLIVFLDFDAFDEAYAGGLTASIDAVREISPQQFDFVLVSKFDLGDLSRSDNRVFAPLLDEREARELAAGMLRASGRNSEASELLLRALEKGPTLSDRPGTFGASVARLIVSGPFDSGLTLAGAVAQRLERTLGFLGEPPDPELVIRIGQALSSIDADDVDMLLAGEFASEHHGLVGLATSIEPCERSLLKHRSKLDTFLQERRHSATFLEAKRLLRMHRRYLGHVDREEARVQFLQLRQFMASAAERHSLSPAVLAVEETRAGMALDCLQIHAWECFEGDWGDVPAFLDDVTIWIADRDTAPPSIVTKALRLVLLAVAPRYGKSPVDLADLRALRSNPARCRAVLALLLHCLDSEKLSNITQQTRADLERLANSAWLENLGPEITSRVQHWVRLIRADSRRSLDRPSVRRSALDRLSRSYKLLEPSVLRKSIDDLIVTCEERTEPVDHAAALRVVRRMLSKAWSLAAEDNVEADLTRFERFFRICDAADASTSSLRGPAAAQPLILLLYALSSPMHAAIRREWLDDIPVLVSRSLQYWSTLSLDDRRRLAEARDEAVDCCGADPLLAQALPALASIPLWSELERAHAFLDHLLLQPTNAALVGELMGVIVTRADSGQPRELTAFGVCYLGALAERAERMGSRPGAEHEALGRLLFQGVALAAFPSRYEGGSEAKRAVRRCFIDGVGRRLAAEHKRPTAIDEINWPRVCETFCARLEERPDELDQPLLAALAMLNPRQARSGNLVVASVRAKKGEHLLTLAERGRGLEIALSLMPAKLFSYCYKQRGEEAVDGYEDEAGRNVNWDRRLLFASIIKGSFEVASSEDRPLQVTARGREYAARVINLLFPVPGGWQRLIEIVDEVGDGRDRPKLWLGGSNSAAVLGLDVSDTSLFLLGGLWPRSLETTLGLNRFTVFSRLSAAGSEETEIRGCVNNLFRDLRIQFEQDGSVVAYDTSNEVLPRKNRTFLSLFRKIYRRQVRIEGFEEFENATAEAYTKSPTPREEQATGEPAATQPEVQDTPI